MTPRHVAVVGAAETAEMGVIPGLSELHLHAAAALNALAAAGLVPGLEVPGEFRAIVNGHFRLERKIEGFSFQGLSGGLGQWLFVRGGIASVTVSAADDLAEEGHASIAGRLWAAVALALGLGDVPLPPHRIRDDRASVGIFNEFAFRRPCPSPKFCRRLGTRPTT